MDQIYLDLLAQPVSRPKANMKQLQDAIQTAVEEFANENFVLEKLKQKSFKIDDYHQLLLRLFHQVTHSSQTFALAGAMTDSRFQAAKDYLFHHAEEEKTHWAWIISDLKNTGYKGADPRTLTAHPSANAYLSYGYFLALKFPLGRLVMAAVLESISAVFGTEYGPLCAKQLNFSANQIQFFQSHGVLDQGHSEDLLAILQKADLPPDMLADGIGVAFTTSQLYKAIYNSISYAYRWF